MERDALNAPDAEEPETVGMLQPPELALNRPAAAVQVTPQGRAALDRRLGLDAALAERDQEAWDRLMRVLEVMKPGLGVSRTEDPD